GGLLPPQQRTSVPPGHAGGTTLGVRRTTPERHGAARSYGERITSRTARPPDTIAAARPGRCDSRCYCERTRSCTARPPDTSAAARSPAPRSRSHAAPEAPRSDAPALRAALGAEST